MSKHVAPHRWRDVFAGNVDHVERAKLEAHAAGCPRCAAVRERIVQASGAFAAIRETGSPELPWDEIRARVHWSVSKEHRTGSMPRIEPRRRWPIFAFAGVAAAAATIVVVRSSGSPAETTPIALAHPDAAIAGDAGAIVPPAAEPTPLVGLVNRFAGDVMIDGVAGDVFARKLVAGDVIATGNGHIDVQFGDGSGFALAPHSTLALHRFDVKTVDFVVEGMVDIQVGPRAADQQFTVHAGGREVTVRGTQFRVTHDSRSTTVACRHGVVTVHDSASSTPPTLVTNAQRVSIANAKPIAGEPVVALTAEELDALVTATPYTLPVWSDDLAKASVPLDLSGAPSRDVRVDGIELGTAPVRVRVLPGRHTIEAADRDGRYRRLGFVDATSRGPAAFAIPEIVAPVVKDLGPRREQLRTKLDRVRLASCVRQLSKSGVAPSAIDVELAVDANGAIGAINIDSDLSTKTSSCIRGVVSDVAFGAGVAGTWHDKILLDR